jgi:type VI secretion system protein ImpK
MRDDTADFVFPVFRYGLRLRKRLLAGHADQMDPQQARTELLKLLQSTPRARSDASGDWSDTPYGDSLRSYSAASRYDRYLGIRYALTCWIDEIMILPTDMPWSDFFNNHKIEVELYGDSLRAVEFWKQARRALAQPTRDPLEVFYLCVMLGFRGELADHPDRLKAWREQVEGQVTDAGGFTPPPATKVKPHVPVLTGARRLQRMLLVATVAGLVLIPVVACAAVLLLGR